MQDQLKNGVAAASSYARKSPNEAKFSAVGAAVGGGIGFLIGGVGIAAKGNASGLSVLVVMLILAFACGMIGNRIGIYVDRKASNV